MSGMKEGHLWGQSCFRMSTSTCAAEGGQAIIPGGSKAGGQRARVRQRHAKVCGEGKQECERDGKAAGGQGAGDGQGGTQQWQRAGAGLCSYQEAPKTQGTGQVSAKLARQLPHLITLSHPYIGACILIELS